MKKRLLTVLLCVIMVMGLLPTVAFADTENTDTVVTPASATYDKYTATDGLKFTLTPNVDPSIVKLKNGPKQLKNTWEFSVTKVTDNGVDSTVYTIFQSYLNRQNVGIVTLTFDIDMPEGIDPTVDIDVSDTNPAIVFDFAGYINRGDTVWFGKYDSYDVPWIMFRDNDPRTMLSKYVLGSSQFDSNNGWFYKDSTLNVKMDDLYNGENSLFTSNERKVIIKQTNLDCKTDIDANKDSPNVPTAYLFPMMEKPVLDYGTNKIGTTYDRSDPNGDSKAWWLRQSDSNHTSQAHAYTGNIRLGRPVTESHGIRPAFDLDRGKVLFASAAVGGKTDTVDSTLTPVGANPTMDNWKLTLPDASRSEFIINTTSLDTSSATINYMNAKTGPNEYISAMIVDNDNDSGTYYGRILQLDGEVNGASGTMTINIPSGVTLDANTELKVFNEQFNGDRTSTNITDASRAYTDYASELITVDAQISDPIEYQITQGANGSYTKGSSDGMQITSNGDYDKFLGVSVDGETISKDKYTSKSGSTIVKLKASYLKTLSVGEHAIKLNFFDGYADTHFTVKAAPKAGTDSDNTDSDSSATGDNSQLLLYLIIALLSGAGLIASLTFRRKNRQNE